MPRIEEKELDGSSLETVRVDSLKIGEGINALKPGAQIDFAIAVTVIFGENGAGKSGFVRVQKRAAGVRIAEDILHNVRSDKRPIPTASFAVTVGTTEQTVDWKNQFGVTPLNRVSIFDARGARLHLEEDLSYVYTPGELTLFPLCRGGEHRRTHRRVEGRGRCAAIPNVQNELKRARDRAGVVTTLKTAIGMARALSLRPMFRGVMRATRPRSGATRRATRLSRVFTLLTLSAQSGVSSSRPERNTSASTPP